MRNCYLVGIASWNTQSKSGWGRGRRTGLREKGGDRGGEDKKKEVVKEEKKDKKKKENDK